jgi:hypothetical protein
MWTTLLTAGAALAGMPSEALLYYGNNGYLYLPGAVTTLSEALASDGATVTVTALWPSDLSAYRLVFLALPAQELSPTAAAQVAEHVARGGGW